MLGFELGTVLAAQAPCCQAGAASLAQKTRQINDVLMEFGVTVT